MRVEGELLLLLRVRPLRHEGLDVVVTSEGLGRLQRQRGRKERQSVRQHVCQCALHVNLSVPKKADALT